MLIKQLVVAEQNLLSHRKILVSQLQVSRTVSCFGPAQRPLNLSLQPQRTLCTLSSVTGNLRRFSTAEYLKLSFKIIFLVL